MSDTSSGVLFLRSGTSALYCLLFDARIKILFHRPWSSSSISVSGVVSSSLCYHILWRLYQDFVSSTWIQQQYYCQWRCFFFALLSNTLTPVSRFCFKDLDPAAVLVPVAFFFDTLYISVVQQLLLFGVQFHVFSTFIPTSIYAEWFQEECT